MDKERRLGREILEELLHGLAESNHRPFTEKARAATALGLLQNDIEVSHAEAIDGILSPIV